MGAFAGASSGTGIDNDHIKVLMEGRDTRWYKNHLLKLNLCLGLLTLASAGNGFDGSMMNGLQ